ncbi:hypothetical protein GCK72_016098 [Caenorhabditis remanei]|uniref:Uncharacterized protein n=1 Tax=Caenorhabditis remanei TaxID=31234 RepID=A0A6A5GY55_CAERE|nr:hypothetical protein GCK72_016098 [Caenorhabditis remanei]KAF1759631.1 hypothetical protein GCK72_016098 [Caenorhabditis remanei]
MNIQLVQLLSQFLLLSLGWLNDGGLKVDGETVAKHRFDEDAECLDVNVGGEDLAEIDLQPADERRVLSLLLGLELVSFRSS